MTVPRASVVLASQLFAVSAILVTASCRKATEPAPRGYGRFDIEFPAGWEILRDIAGSKVAARSPALADSRAFRANINVFEVAVSDNMTAAAYLEAVQAQMTADLREYKFHSNGSAKLAGREAPWTEYSHLVLGQRVRAKLYVLVAGGNAYGLTISSADREFDWRATEFDAALGSFTLLE